MGYPVYAFLIKTLHKRGKYISLKIYYPSIPLDGVMFQYLTKVLQLKKEVSEVAQLEVIYINVI